MFDFGSNREVKDLAGVPETFRAFYKEKTEGGGYALDTESPVVRGAVEALSGARTALGSVRTEVDALKAGKIDLSPLKDFGDAPDKIKAAIEAKIAELQGQIKDGTDIQQQLDSQRTEMTATHEKEKKGLLGQIEALQTQLYTELVDGETLKAVADTSDNPKLVLPFVRELVKPIQTDAGIQIRVLKKGTDEIRMSGTTGLPMTVEELVTEMRGSKDYAGLFKSEAKQGSGHRPGTGGGGSPRGAGDMTANQKIAAGLPGLRS
jgi:hypothetical protein